MRVTSSQIALRLVPSQLLARTFVAKTVETPFPCLDYRVHGEAGGRGRASGTDDQADPGR